MRVGRGLTTSGETECPSLAINPPWEGWAWVVTISKSRTEDFPLQSNGQ